MVFKNIIVIHHSALPLSISNQFEIIDNAHREKGWSKIAYHWFIGSDGTVKQGRSEDENGAHCFSWKHPKSWMVNSTTFGICCAGLGQLNERQEKSLNSLIKEIKSKYGKCEIRPHLYYVPTICPGRKIMKWLRNINVDNSKESLRKRQIPIRKKVKEYLDDIFNKEKKENSRADEGMWREEAEDRKL